MSRDEHFMRLAMQEAEKAAAAGDVPVGAVIVKNGEIIARGHNTREQRGDVLGHAELEAIRSACAVLGDWRLTGCTLYVTLEPCPMCAGAVINARLDRVVFGAYDHRAGSFGSLINLASYPYNHRPDLTGGVLEEEAKALMVAFFKEKR